MDLRHIRNFSIIAHIDHGKSTLADRMLEITNTVETRKMKDQVLDNMELERERGITIKMQPVRMEHEYKGSQYVLNLIDTPGHIDFSYEVSRALKAVEGSILLVDATQGVQAQTLTTLAMAKESGLVIIPVLSKIDSPLARVDEIKLELALLLECELEDIYEVSGKTGEGVLELLGVLIEQVPPPESEFPETKSFRGLVFDFEYSTHTGVIMYVRILDGEVKKSDSVKFIAANEKFGALAVGVFKPNPVDIDSIKAGEIGYIVTGIKKPGIVSVGDTVTLVKEPLPPLAGYEESKPVVWASMYPESQDDFPLLRQSLEQLKLSDSSISFEEEFSTSLGRGFRCGFLGMLHLEIVTERLHREFNLELVITTPTITYEIEYIDGTKKLIYTPTLFPDHGVAKMIREPWIDAKIITPPEYVGGITQMFYDHEAIVGESGVFGDNRTSIAFQMPLRELMRGFFDELKSVSSGFGSLSYEIGGLKEADVVRLDLILADEVMPAFSRVVSKRRVEGDAKDIVERLHAVLPRQQFVCKIQGKAMGRIMASKTLAAFRKDVTAKLYGGDITRKMKLLEKQKKGKKKMRARGKVHVPQDVFLKMMKNTDK